MSKNYTVKFAGRSIDTDTIDKARELLLSPGMGSTAHIHYNKGGIDKFVPSKGPLVSDRLV